MATVSQRLAFIISANADQAVKAFEKTANSAEKQMGKAERTLQKTGASLTRFGAAGLAAAGTLGAGLGKLAQGAIEDQKAQALLATQLRNSTNATNQQVASVERLIDSTARAVGISDDQLRPAFANLTRATGDLDKAQSLLTLSLDISAQTGRDLESVTLAIGRAANGQFGALTRLGIPIDEATKKSKDFNRVLGLLSTQFGGAATTAANTYEGQVRRTQVALSEAGEEIGQAFIPVITTAATVIRNGVGAFSEFNDRTGGAAGSLATFTTVGLGAISTMSLLSGQAIKMRDRFFNVNAETGKLSGGLTAVGKTSLLTAGVIATATTIYGLYSKQKKEATERTKNLTEALKLESGAQKEAVATLIENDKKTAEFVDSLRLLGLSFSDVQNEVNGYSTQFTKVREAVEKFNASSGEGEVTTRNFAEAIGYSGTLTAEQVVGLVNMVAELDRLRDAQDKATAAQRRANEVMTNRTGKTKAQIEAEEIATKITKTNTDTTNKASDAQDKLRQKVEQAADAFRSKMNTALQAAQDNVKKATQEFNDYQKQISTAITDTIGFSTAFGKLQENVQSVADGKQALADADKRVAEANKDVIDAETNLAAIMRDPSSDPKEIARANEQVADAKDRAAEATREQAKAAKDLADAQGRPQTFLGALQAQQVQAQTFATNLQKLVDLGLSQGAIDQIASIGAEAGNAIATEILTSANPAEYKDKVNGIISGMQDIADSVGLSAAEKFKRAGIESATALVTGMDSILSQYQIKLNWKSLSKSKKPIKTIADFQRVFMEEMSGQFRMARVDVPEMADGGIVKARSGGTLVRLGEGGQDEAVLPLPAPTSMGSTVNITVNTGVGDPVQIGQTIVEYLQRYQTRVGKLALKVG